MFEIPAVCLTMSLLKDHFYCCFNQFCKEEDRSMVADRFGKNAVGGRPGENRNQDNDGHEDSDGYCYDLMVIERFHVVSFC